MADRLDYDRIASTFDERYRLNAYPELEAYLRATCPPGRVLEVGCGTGRWLALLADAGAVVAGIDPSQEMLQRARSRLGDAELVAGRAAELPWSDGAFDHVLAVNALHHFDEGPAFLAEARRVLRPGGSLIVVGLDPHRGLDQWWIYDWFPGSLERDRVRYPDTVELRRRFAEEGFVDVKTSVAQHLRLSLVARDALETPLLAKHSTSQLALLSNDQYDEGVGRIQRADERSADGLRLEIDLRLWATVGCR